MEEFLAQFEPMHRAKRRGALERQMRLNGRYMFRYQAAEILVNQFVRIDETKGRFYTSDNTFFDVSALTQTLVDYVLWLRTSTITQS